jgi:hypothetical protein
VRPRSGFAKYPDFTNSIARGGNHAAELQIEFQE